MKKKSTSQFGFFNPRICVALLLCLSGVSMAVLSFAMPLRSSAPSPVIVTEFSDFQCPYCQQAAMVVEQLRQTYGDNVKFVFKQMPLPFHQYAFKAAQAAVIAQQQGKFWEFHDRLFAAHDLSVDALKHMAVEVGLKEDEFNQDLDSETIRTVVQKDIEEARQLGVRGTPTFFVNGRVVREPSSFTALKQEIDRAMLGLPDPGPMGAGQSRDVWPLLPKTGVSDAARLGPARSANIAAKNRSSLTQLRLPRSELAWNHVGAGGPQWGLNNGLWLQTVAFAFLQPSLAGQPTLSINDVTVAEDSCQNTALFFTVTLSYLGRQPATVNYATSDGSPSGTGTAAVGGKDYVPVAGTLTFTHSMPPNGPKGSYLKTVTVPLGNYVVSTGTNDGRAFTITLSGATNATVSKSQGVGTLLDAALSCMPTQNAGCFVNFCGATTSCKNVNISATATPFCQLALNGTNFDTCSAAGLWRDSDGDGFSDAAEAQGYIDVNANGVYDAGIDIPLPGADPNKPDVYLHYDYTVASDHSHNPPPQAIQWVVDAFAAHGINLHIDPQHNALCENAGDAGCITVGTGAHVATLMADPDPACVGTSAVSPAQVRAAIPYLNLIKPAYHYTIFGHYVGCPGDDAGRCANCPNDPEVPACGTTIASKPTGEGFGMAEVLGDDSIVATQPFVDIGIPVSLIPLESWAGIAMHELGHNLGLLHGGTPTPGDAGTSACNNFKPNYVSVMSYSFYTKGIEVAASPGSTVPQSCATDADCNDGDHAVPAHCSTTFKTCFRIDYSDRTFNTLDENNLDETVGLQGGANNTDISRWFGGPGYVRVPTNGTPIDWNKDGNFTDTGVMNEINDSDGREVEYPQNDWAITPINGVNNFTNLKFDYQCSPNFGD
jgi:protein-disulfide isomerase